MKREHRSDHLIFHGFPVNRFRDGLTLKSSEFLPVLDFVGLIISAYFSLILYEVLIAASGWQPPAWGDMLRMASMTAGLGAFVLHDRRFDHFAKRSDSRALAGRFAGHALVFLGVLTVIAFAGRWLKNLPSGWLILWLVGFACLAMSTRSLLLQRIRSRDDHDVKTGFDVEPAMVTSVSSAAFNRLVGDRLSVRLLADRPIKRWNAALKSVEDSVLGVILLALLLPVMLLIVFAIRLDSPGPVLFLQRRHGFKSREFEIYKFRTMHTASQPCAGGALQQTLRDDARVTRVGRVLRKYSLDELPQIFNVLEGSMSLVGPRPHAVNMRTEQRLGQEIVNDYLHRHRVKPGITGWSQVNGSRGATDTVAQLRQRVELDLHYVENWSLLLDLKILSHTFKVVLRATNAY